MRNVRDLLLSCLLVFGPGLQAVSQRNYAPSSVLATGSWYKVSVKQEGIHKIDLPLLQALGVNTQNLGSASVRVFGNGGRMLSEANNGEWTDDLQEIAIGVEDGGDGVLNGADHLIFYASGPHGWTKDSLNQRFSHQLNIYSDVAYYFITVGGIGKRVSTAPLIPPAGNIVTI